MAGDLVTIENVVESELHLFETEASLLGLRSGEWPKFITTNLGNTLSFMRESAKKDVDGDLMWVTYRQCNGIIKLRVTND